MSNGNLSNGNLRDAALKMAPRKKGPMRWLSKIGWFLWQITRWLLVPFRLLLLLRRSMTASSVVLLLFGIVSVNIIWGYPWTGIFSACSSLFVLGWIFNRSFQPKLQIDISLPQSVPAGQSFSFLTHLRNRRKIPAMDLEIELVQETPKKSRSVTFDSLSNRILLSVLLPKERHDLQSTMVIHRRGMHTLPDLLVTSMFPFHLFRFHIQQPVNAAIAVTPALLSGSEDLAAQHQLNSLGNWSRKLLAGDALDYTGSREYEYGMPVRRWDFTSWARLGKPIVREFQSPSIRMLTLIVDTATDLDRPRGHDSDEVPVIERTLSLAATALTELGRKNVGVQMMVTSETGAELNETLSQIESGATSDLQMALIRLATADVTTSQNGDHAIEQMVDLLGSSPTLILTSRRSLSIEKRLPATVSILRVDIDQESQEDTVLSPGTRASGSEAASGNSHPTLTSVTGV